MSLIGAMDTAVSGLKVASLQVQNAANNIANASDPNFTKKSLLQAPNNLGGSGAGGVLVIGYDRAVDKALNRTYSDAITAASFNDIQSEYYSTVKDIYGISSDTAALSSNLSDFIGAWQSFAAAPEDSVRQREVIATGNSFATEIRRIGSAITSLERTLDQARTDSVAEVNDLLIRIDGLNDQIARASATNEPAGNLEDQRDDALRQLSQYMNVRQLDGDLGRVRLITPGGFVILDDSPVVFVNGTSGYETEGGINVDNMLTGGRLQGLRYLTEDTSPAAANTDPGREVIRKLRSQLEALADSFIDTAGTPQTFAAAYNTGTATTGELATGFFTGTGAGDIVVNAALLNGTSRVKAASVDTVVDMLQDNTRDYTADGLTVPDTSYTGYIATMLGVIGSSASTLEGRAQLTAAAEQTYKERYANVTGVNVDEELVSLTRFQNSYSAVARVITVVQEMFRTLDTIVA